MKMARGVSKTCAGMGSLLTFAAILVSVTLMAAACGGSNNSPEGANAGRAAEHGPADRTAHFRFAINLGFNSIDPHRTSQPLGDDIWLRPLYDSLVTVVSTAEGVELAPQLAESFDIAPDGQSIEFVLRDDVSFQDGTRFSADAVKVNIERAKGPDSTVASTLRNLQSVEVIGDTQVVFRLSEPDPAFVWTLALGTAGMMISPAALHTDLNAKPVGSGPFTLVSAAKDADVVYERWDGHWDAGAALVERLTISTIADGNARYNSLRAGEFDAARLTSPQNVQAKSLEPEGFHFVQAFSPYSYGLHLNASRSPLDDVRVRRAIWLAIDRHEISEELMQGIDPPAYQVFNEGFVGYDESLDKDLLNLDEARGLVRQAGADGATVTLIQMTTPPYEAMSQVVQQSLGDIGLNVELTPLSPTEAGSAWRRGGHQAIVQPIIGQVDPSQTLPISYLGGNNPAPPPTELVEMASEAKVLPLGSNERNEAYQEINRYLIQNPVHVPIVMFSAVIVTRPNVVGAPNLLTQQLHDLDFRQVGKTEA